MTRQHFNPPVVDGTLWGPTALKPKLDEHDNAINTLEQFGRRGDYMQRIAIPSYFWASWYTTNGGDWARMQAAAPVADICIVNVGSGPGSAVNTDWQAQAKLAKAAGLTVIGYVSTNYTGVAAASVKSQVDQHFTWYDVDGIFLDEADNPIGGTIANTLTYYGDLYAYIKGKGGLVVINPGQPSIDERLMAACDVVMNYENSAANYSATSFPTWTANYPARKFWHCIYGVTDAAQRDTLLALSRARRAGYVYLTTDIYVNPATDNPYDSLPPEPFWSGLVAAISEPAQAGVARRSIATPPTQTLTWDGTNGGAADVQGRQRVDPTFWSYDLGGGETPIGSGNRWGNWQEEVSTDNLRNVCVKNGQLQITLVKETTPSPVGGEVTGNFSSGRIHTGPPIGGGASKYLVPVNSYYEARIWMPEVPGAWPAFWMMGANWVKQANHDANWPYCGEIDTVECFGQNPYTAGFALHMPETGTANDTLAWQHNKFMGWRNEETAVDPLTDGLTQPIGKPHIYGLWRSATEIRAYIDHEERFRYTQAQATASGRMWPFNQGFFIIINLAAGGQAGSTANIGGMGARMTVDPIKVWTGITDPATLGLS